jgi:hypothetical protein
VLAPGNSGDTTPALRPLEARIITAPIPPAEMSDADLARGASDAIDRAAAMKEGAAEQALIAGELLLEAQHRCHEKGVSFRQWLVKHWTTKSKTTALAYIKIATEVQRKLVGAPTTPEERKGLLAHQSIRAFLSDHGYGAGGTRDPVDAEDAADGEQATIDRLAQEREAERQTRKPDRRTQADEAPRQRGGLSSSLTPEEQLRRAEVSRKIAEERAALEAAAKNNPLVPPENPHQVGRPKPPEPAPDPETTCNAHELREVASLLTRLAQDAWAALGKANAIRFALVPNDDGRRDEEMLQIRAAISEVAGATESLAKKRGQQLLALASHEAHVIGAERERLHKEAKKAARRGA